MAGVDAIFFRETAARRLLEQEPCARETGQKIVLVCSRTFTRLESGVAPQTPFS